MELRIIDGQPMIVIRTGQRESKHSPEKVVAQARQHIAEAQATIGILTQSQATELAALEAALLRDAPTAPIRREISNLAELMEGERQKMGSAQADILRIEQLLDMHAATQIALDDADAIAALIEPFDQFLEAHQ